MVRARLDRVLELFQASLAVPPSERRRFLEERSAGDPVLLRDVEELLEQDRRGGDHFEPPSSAELRRALGDGEPEDLIGSSVGAYRLDEVLGRGGVGTVYRARRTGTDFDQVAAVKVIRRGMDTDDILERFARERRALARLDHPGIARFLDGGATPDGRPYLVMECVDGEPIDLHCARHDLSLEKRLRLFLRVCSAVEYAHELRLVHRDIKPSNVLVTPSGQPKLLDFGIAKVLDEAGQALTVELTATELRILTPEYASPEQLRGERADVRTDVYALGVLLYELLTGVRPHEVRTGLRRDLERVVCEQDPLRPSRRMASRRQRLRLAGDLDTIALTALRRERERRYASVPELAEDLRRHLAGRRVLARPDTWRYRTSTFVRRNRLLVAAATAVGVSLVAGLVGTLVMFREAEAQRRDWLVREYVARIAAAEGALRSNDPVGARAQLAASPPEERGWEWRHLLARTDSSTLALGGHGEYVTAIAWSPDSRLLAASRSRGGLVLWDVDARTEVRTWDFAESVPALAFASGGRLLATLEGSALRMLEVDTGAVLWERPGPFLWSALDPSGERVAGVAGEYAVLLDASGNDMARLEHPGMPLERCTFGASGERVALASLDGHLLEWDVASGEARPLAGGAAIAGTLHTLGFAGLAATGDSIVAGTTDGELQAWDTRSGERVLDLRAHGDRVIGVDVHAGTSRIATASLDGSVRVWDAATGALSDTLFGHASKLLVVRFDPSGRRVAAGGGGDRVRVWELPTAEAAPIRGDRGWRMGLALAPRADRLAIAAWEEWSGSRLGVASWDLTARAPRWRRTFEAPAAVGQPNLMEVAWSPDGARVLATDAGPDLHVWNAETGALESAWPVGPGVWTLAFAPDGASLAIGNLEVRLLDAMTGRTTRHLGATPAQVEGLDFAPDGQLLAVGGPHVPPFLIEVASAERRAALGGRGAVSVAFSPDGAELATSAGNEVRLWRVADASPRAQLVGHTAEVRDVAWSPDGTRLVSASVDRTLMLWDPATGRPVATLHGHESAVDKVVFSRDGRRIVSQDRNGAVRVWDAPSLADDR